MRRLLARDEALAQQGDVLVVPSVAVGESRAVGDAADLVPADASRRLVGVCASVSAKVWMCQRVGDSGLGYGWLWRNLDI